MIKDDAVFFFLRRIVERGFSEFTTALLLVITL